MYDSFKEFVFTYSFYFVVLFTIFTAITQVAAIILLRERKDKKPTSMFSKIYLMIVVPIVFALAWFSLYIYKITADFSAVEDVVPFVSFHLAILTGFSFLIFCLYFYLLYRKPKEVA